MSIDDRSHPTPLHVVAVRAHRHRSPLLRPFVTAARRTDSVAFVVAEVELDGGVVGGRGLHMRARGGQFRPAAGGHGEERRPMGAVVPDAFP